MKYKYSRYVTESHECLAVENYKIRFVNFINDIVERNGKTLLNINEYKIFANDVAIDFDELMNARYSGRFAEQGKSVDLIVGVTDEHAQSLMLLVELKLNQGDHISRDTAAAKEKFRNSIVELGESVTPVNLYPIVYNNETYALMRSKFERGRGIKDIDKWPFKPYSITEFKNEFF